MALNAADGSVKWQVDLPAMNVGAATVANDVVFTATLDGVFRAYDTDDRGAAVQPSSGPASTRRRRWRATSWWWPRRAR